MKICIHQKEVNSHNNITIMFYMNLYLYVCNGLPYIGLMTMW